MCAGSWAVNSVTGSCLPPLSLPQQARRRPGEAALIVKELEGDHLKVLCPDSLTLDRLKTDAVATVLKEVTSAHVGHAIRVSFEVGKPRPTTQEERLQNLINFGSQFDSFTIR